MIELQPTFDSRTNPVPTNSHPAASEDQTLEALWQVVESRDSRFDGLLFYGVTSTGIFCRPTCPSRRPKRENVVFFATVEGAEASGLRACKRCRPAAKEAASPEERLVLDACARIEGDGETAPAIGELASTLGVSERHLRDVFERVLGVSPARYAQALRLGRLRSSLRAGTSVTDAIYEAGFGSPSRVYERSGEQLGMTPATYRKAGENARIGFAVADSAIGKLLVAGTKKGLCSVRIGDDVNALTTELEEEFHRAELVAGASWVEPWLGALVDYAAGSAAWPALPVDVRATAFQATVWAALRRIPEGTTITYAELARAIGKPKAARAVGRACATNPVALAVPCHRVIAADGALRGYRWGEPVKRQLIDMEAE